MRVFTRARMRPLGAVALCLFAYGSLIAQRAQAQAVPPKPAAPGAAIVQRLDYVIVKEDVIEIQVLNHGDYSRVLAVDPTGFVDYPILGAYKAEGKKLGDFRSDIIKALKKRFVNPEVSVSVRSRPPKFISVFGSTGAKGKIPYKEDWRLLDAVAAAGGIVGSLGPTDRYDLYTITLQRAKTGESIKIDPVKLFAGDETQNVPVNEDDILTVYERPAAELQVQVVGQVKAPSAVGLPASRSIRDVLQLAGNPTEVAQLSKAFIRRRQPDGTEEIIGVDLRGYVLQGFEPRLDSNESAAQKRPVYKQGGDGTPLKLQGADVLVIPENRERYNLLGRFAVPGAKIYPDDRTVTLMEAIAESGGQTDGAELKKARVTRKDPGDPAAASQMEKNGWKKQAGEDGGVVYTKIVNVEAMLKSGNRKDNIALIPGDEVYVQATGARRGFGLNEIAGLAGAITTFLFLRSQL